jgi:hypothetical protein
MLMCIRQLEAALCEGYRIVEVNDMTDEIATAPLADPFYDGRKSGSAARAGRGVEVRVREVRRRNWSSEGKRRGGGTVGFALTVGGG